MAPPPLSQLSSSPSLHFSSTTHGHFILSPHPSKLFLQSPKPHPYFTPKASSEPNNSTPSPDDNKEDDFEARLANMGNRYSRIGQGVKAEKRKMKKAKKQGATSSSSSSSSVFLPPVPLKEPISDGLKVDFGFSPFSEKVNGRLAGIGLVALLLVELATGKSAISYHTPSIIFIQLYFMAAATALYLKVEKEKVSVWP